MIADLLKSHFQLGFLIFDGYNTQVMLRTQPAQAFRTFLTRKTLRNYSTNLFYETVVFILKQCPIGPIRIRKLVVFALKASNFDQCNLNERTFRALQTEVERTCIGPNVQRNAIGIFVSVLGQVL